MAHIRLPPLDSGLVFKVKVCNTLHVVQSSLDIDWASMLLKRPRVPTTLSVPDVKHEDVCGKLGSETDVCVQVTSGNP